MFKSNGGFTLVELIVVIAILAILAGIAVPAYTGYIRKAEEAADMQFLGTVNTAVQGLAAATGKAVEEINVSASGVTVSPADIVTVSEVYELLGADSATEAMKPVDGFTAQWTDDTGKWEITYITEKGE